MVKPLLAAAVISACRWRNGERALLCSPLHHLQHSDWNA